MAAVTGVTSVTTIAPPFLGPVGSWTRVPGACQRFKEESVARSDPSRTSTPNQPPFNTGEEGAAVTRDPWGERLAAASTMEELVEVLLENALDEKLPVQARFVSLSFLLEAAGLKCGARARARKLLADGFTREELVGEIRSRVEEARARPNAKPALH